MCTGWWVLGTGGCCLQDTERDYRGRDGAKLKHGDDLFELRTWDYSMKDKYVPQDFFCVSLLSTDALSAMH